MTHQLPLGVKLRDSSVFDSFFAGRNESTVEVARSLRAGRLIRNEQEPSTVADGARTISLGDLNWEILRQGIADILEVPDPTTLAALREYFALNLKVEPTGALALGAVLAYPERFAGKRVCCIVSGGNVDPLVYAQALQEG